MNSGRKQKLIFLACLLASAWLNEACATAQTAPIKPLPIYEQCPSLATGAGGAASDDAVAQAIAALKSQDAKARASAAQQLGKACDSRAVEPLIDALNDKDTDARIAVIEALGRLGDANSVQPMIEIVGSADWRARMALVSAFASFKTFLGRNAIVNHIANPSGADITDENDMRVRCAAILTACQLTDVTYSRKSILFLYGFLQSSHSNIRKLAEATLMELKNTRNGGSEMASILKQSNDPTLRRWAAEWIGKIGLEGARDALQQAATSDPDASVRQLAAESLKQLPTVK